MEKNDTLKLIAAVSMVIDHIGAVFFPNIILFRILGRIAFPIFAYQSAMGAVYTKNIQKYLMRIFLFACISQPVYEAVFGKHLNILFTLFYSVSVVALFKTEKVWAKGIGVIMLCFCFGIKLDYGAYGVFSVLFFYILFERPFYCVLVQSFLCFWYSKSIFVMAQMAGLFALPLLYKKWKISICLPRYFFYFFYPVHLFLILVIKRMF